ncbi:MAG TPA: nucleotide exchange factor GrpE [Blastocatellia bacterium]
MVEDEKEIPVIFLDSDELDRGELAGDGPGLAPAAAEDASETAADSEQAPAARTVEAPANEARTDEPAAQAASEGLSPEPKEKPEAVEAHPADPGMKRQNGHAPVSGGPQKDDVTIVPVDDQLQTKIDSLVVERSALYDQLLRVQAEFENFRKRTEREKADLYQRARGEILLEFLPIMDNFDRALASSDKSPIDAESLRMGLELIHRQLSDALIRMGLQPIESLGTHFDPNVHEAITIEHSDEHEENTVVQEFERGYKLGERLLRPAKVKVASSPPR